MRHKITAAILTTLLAAPAVSNADMLAFSYSFSGGAVLSGTIDGTPSGDDVLGATLLSASFSGDPTIVFNPALLANTITFSGAGLEFVTDAPSLALGLGGFQLLQVEDLALVADKNWPPPILEEGFARARWSLRPVAAPEPMSLGLLGIGLAALAMRRRRA